MSERLSLNNLCLGYEKEIVVPDLSLEIEPGSFTALLGPSGCGKSTTMRAIAGLLPVRSGSIKLNDRDLTDLPPNRRGIGLVFQSYALFPHLSVQSNVAFGLKMQRQPDNEIKERAVDALKRVGMYEFAQRMPADLSGGQQQRVALARALVLRPSVLLLDEPLSNLDARLRIEMRTELQRLQREFDVTILYVTHDQSEAMALADQVAVMRDGNIEQLDAPEQIWLEPSSDFVASFVGFENIFAVRSGKMLTPGQDLELSDLDQEVQGLAWRPSDIVLGSGPHSATIAGASFLGQGRAFSLDTPFGPILAEISDTSIKHALGERISFDLPIGSAAKLSKCSAEKIEKQD